MTQPGTPPDHIDSSGNKYWQNSHGKMHRLDGPALEYADGSREFFIDGVNITLDEFLAHPKRKSLKKGSSDSHNKPDTYVSPFTGKIT